ncbi:MAG: type III-B CRISPR module RAMP protein Cmr1 [candidate division WOR-3 bacterium]
MTNIEFQIKLITPLLIHGADSGELDNMGLTGKALRGCWRFWFRAIVGGLLNDLNPEQIYKRESEIFGSADEDVGAKFKLLVEPIRELETGSYSIKFSRKKINFIGYKEGTEFKITIIPKKDYSENQKNVLLATIWTWANLGAVGQRARRGFGSVVIKNSTRRIFPNGLSIKAYFSNCDELTKHLQKGFCEVQDIFIKWLGSGIAQKKTGVPQDAEYFILQSFDQIKVADIPIKTLDGALNKVHGSDRCKSLGWIRNGRMASPVYTRFHIVNNQYLPIITFCHQKVNGFPNFNDFLNCLHAYMYGRQCAHRVSFPNIGF